MVSTQEQYEYLIARYDEEKYFPPKPVRTINEMRDDDECFWAAYQKAFDYFFYSDLIIEGKEMAEMMGIEYTKEFYEEMFNLGMFQFSMTYDDPFRGQFVSLLYWTGTYFREEGRL